ncbi:sushi, von Willebrand factor type A, EGF and pentraxin domain-containing protein 1-like [Ylistrum balloti]|uniref:sushi, von Willebrand factor type A, EGF and pentraxin domain-containing protein 1-like n=1 Tax=Ylistrum balloti TaxID=509963 RepID=UPI002905D269|nr:sushi, von Willebrand factor type A, EGF and pentraxin domain-containing protein 1-like [Ylistrum balloti]
MYYIRDTFIFTYLLYLMKGSYAGICPENCAAKSCDDPDGGCPKCEKEWWGRQCNNPMGCYWAEDPAKYRGTTSVTVSGIVCQQWSSSIPHSHRYKDLTQGAKNYCRSPENHPVPWCLTTYGKVARQDCDVPRCDSRKLCPVPTFPVQKVLPEGVPFTKPFFSGTSLRVVISCGTLQKEATIWCLSNQMWASSGGCTDLVAYCPRPALERNTYIFNDHDSVYRHNDTIDIRCLEGFTIQGSGTLECQEDGTWNGTLPTCYMNGSNLCPSMCEDDLSCDNEDRGCPKCKPTRWGRHCEYYMECYNTDRGSDYRGIHNRTADGLLCQNWNSRVPHKHPFGDRVDDGAANYCRNPDLEPSPWCYTTNPNVRWKRCNVPKCDTVCQPPEMSMYSHLTEVTSSPFSVGYELFINMTCDGKNVTMVTRCQSDLTWSHNVSCDAVHCGRPTLNKDSFIVRDRSSRLYAQYDTIEVRCPVGFIQGGQHLFQCQADRTWNGSMPTCDGGTCPPKCAKGVPCTEADRACPRCSPGYWGRHCQYPLECYVNRGANYRGTVSITVSGRKCQSWNSTSPHKHRLKLPNSENFCRNPDNEPKPWCYTVDPRRRWEVCPVPRCNDGAVCPPPELPMYSSVASPMDSVFYTGSTIMVNLTCGGTYELVNIICESNRKWTMDRLSCSAVFCDSPTLRDNSHIIEGTEGPYQQNDTIEVGCELGYYTTGQTMFRCLYNSQWNGTMPICTGVSCPELHPSSNSHIEDISVSYTYADVTIVRCDTGYTLVGDSHLYCQADGTWNTSLPTCQAVVCPVPVLNDNSLVENGSNPYVFGDIIHVKCKQGYQLFGYDIFMCKSDGRWDGNFPVCKGTCPLHCKDSQICDDPDGGCPDCEPAWWGRHCQYPLGCRLSPQGTEYRGEMNSTISGRVCQAWSDTTVHTHKYEKFVDIEANNFCRNPDNETCPWCYTVDPDVRWELCPVPLCSSLAQCPPPVLPQNVTVINPPQIAFFTGSVLLLELKCGEGFKTVSSPRIKCLENNTWTYSIPSCQAVRCKHQALPDHSYITGMSVTHFPYVLSVQVSCKDGYTLQGPSQLTCSHPNYSWNVTKCKPIVCQKPALSAFSYVDQNKNEYPFGSQIMVKCTQLYRRVGQGRFRCLSDGRWDGEMPECKAPSCSLPKVPMSHLVDVRSLADMSPGGNVTVVCRNTNGTSVLQCLPNGTFSGTIPECKATGCGPPTMPQDKYVVVKHENDMDTGSTLMVHCVSGMELYGPEELTCLTNGSWSNDNSECKMIRCPSPVLPDHSVIVRGKKTVYRYGDTVLVICLEGYSPLYPVTLVCQHDKTWNGTMHRCDALSCQVPTPPDTLQYIIKSSADLQFGGTLTVGCKAGYKTLGNEQMICEANGRWAGHLPDCQAMTCMLPSLSSDLYVMVDQGNGVTPGDIISVWCRPGMKVVGFPYLKCLKDGTWNASTPTCQHINCSPPLGIDYNIIPKKKSYIYKDTISVYCKDGFELQGASTLACGLDGTWGTNQPWCSEVKCALPPLSDLHVLNMDQTSSLSVGGIVHVGCTNNKKSVNLRCRKDKTWNSSLPACDKIKTVVQVPPEADSGDDLSVLDIGIIAACVAAILVTGIAATTYFLVRKFRKSRRLKSSNIAITYKDMEHEF